MSNQFNFISENVTEDDIKLFIQPDFNDVIIRMESHWNMANVMCIAGLFKSITQARKNGWNKDLPKGFWTKEIGKKRISITILNKVE